MKKLRWGLVAILVLVGFVSVSGRALRFTLELAYIALIPFGVEDSLRESLPKEFEAPRSLETLDFRIRPIRVSDYRSDYEAIMKSRARLNGIGGDDSDWPAEDFALVDNYLHLVHDQWRHDRVEAFTYTVASLDEKRTLGCVYIMPARNTKFTVEVVYWVTEGEGAEIRDLQFGEAVQAWMKSAWPFASDKVAYPGRTHSWKDYLPLARN